MKASVAPPARQPLNNMTYDTRVHAHARMQEPYHQHASIIYHVVITH